MESLKLELEEQRKKDNNADAVVVNNNKKKMKMHESGDDRSNNKKVMSSIMEGVSVSLPFHKDGGNNVGRIDKNTLMIKSESNDSLTSATSYDDSVSSIEEDHGVAVGEAVADE